jgi:hypothetical protein
MTIYREMLSGATCFPCCRLLAFWASSILDALTDLMGMYSFREYYTLSGIDDI